MATKSSAAADVTRPSLSFKRRLNAPPAKVYAAWTDPQKIIRWFGTLGRQTELVPGGDQRTDRRTFSRQLFHR